jgi:hypothetical protein
MSTHEDDDLMRNAFAPARGLEPSESEVGRVMAGLRAAPRRPRQFHAAGWRGLAVPGLAALALLGGGAYAVPPTRAAIDDVAGSVAGTFTGWLGGDSAEAPGRPLAGSDQAPFYFDNGNVHEPRVIAEAGGYKLYAYIGASGGLSFDLGDTGFGEGFEKASEINGHALYVLGPGAMRYADAHGHVPLFGVTASSVTSVELTYESGPPLRVDGVKGGFVLLAEPSRNPQEVLGLDAEGNVVGQKPVGDIEWQRYVSNAG